MTASLTSLCYLFGVVAAGSRLPALDDGGPLQRVRLVEADDLAAVVGTPPADRPVGRAADLLAHDRVLSALVAADVAVLPMRFGAVLADEDSVVRDVLAARHDELQAELAVVDGCVQFNVKVHYDEDVVLREVVSTNPDIARIRRQEPATGTLDQRVRLGEMVVRAIAQLRSKDAQVVLDEIGDVVDVRVHESASPEEVVSVAALVDRRQSARFERRIDALARRHHPRMRVRLVGPSPAYDFVGGG